MPKSAAHPVTDGPETRDLFVESWPKHCACGHDISEDEWETLRYVGLQKVPSDLGIPDLELRNCPSCHSTIGIAVPDDYT